MNKIDLKSLFNKYYSSPKDIEIVIQKLRDAGASQMECTRTLVSELKMSIPEADEIIVNSKAWSDVKDQVEKFRDDMFDAAQEL